MVARAANFFPTGNNAYVPGMAYDSKLVHGQPSAFSLGTPAAYSATVITSAGVNPNAAANTEVSLAYTMGATYGRNIVLTPSGDPGANGVIDFFGFDFLGQPMVERFSLVSGSTAILYGKKAFKYVAKSKVSAACANAVTLAVGIGHRLGLPFKGDISWVKENGVLIPLYKRDFSLQGGLSDADVTSGASLMWRAPCAGFVKTLYGLPSGAGSTTNAAATVEIATVAVTGLTVTVDQDTQTIVSDVPTTEGYNANNRFRPGDLLEIVHAATTSGGPVNYELEITPTQFILPTLTDPQTNITGDPRGTYEPMMTMDGAKEIIVGLTGDNSVNSSGNGGLHGIRHVNA